MIENAINFEKEVAKVILKKNYDVLPSGMHKNYDFYINVNEKKILIEVKVWRKSPPYSIIRRTVERLSEAVINESASEGILVTQKPLRIDGEISKENNVKLMTLNELKRYLSI